MSELIRGLTCTGGIKLIVDINLFVDDSVSIDRTLQPEHRGKTRSIPYRLLQYTNCFSQSPWQCHGKEIYHVLVSYVNVTDVIIYCKCPEKYGRWVKRERKAWFKRELGHNRHPFLISNSKKCLKPFVCEDCILVTDNENLLNYWNSLSGRSILYSLAETCSMADNVNTIAEKLQAFRGDFFPNKGENMEQRGDDVAVECGDNDSRNGSLQEVLTLGCSFCNSMNDVISLDDCSEDEMTVDCGKNELSDNMTDPHCPKTSTQENASHCMGQSKEIIVLDSTGDDSKNIEDTIDSHNTSTCLLTLPSGSYPKCLRDDDDVLLMQDNTGSEELCIDNSEDCNDSPVMSDGGTSPADEYQSFCEEFAGSLLIVRNLILLCKCFDYTSFNENMSRFKRFGLMGMARCTVVNALLFNKSLEMSILCSSFCKDIRLRVLQTRRITRKSSKDIPIEFVNVDVEYSFIQSLRGIISCESCFGNAVINYIIEEQLGEIDRNEKSNGAQFLDDVNHHNLLKRYISAAINGSELHPQRLPLKFSSCPTCFLPQDSILRGFIYNIVHHTLSVVVTNYSMHVHPTIALVHRIEVSSNSSMRLESAFSSAKHVSLYLHARTWKAQIYAAVRACVSEHNARSGNQWKKFCETPASDSDKNSAGSGDKASLCLAKKRVDLNSTRCNESNQGGPMMSYCTDASSDHVDELVQDVMESFRSCDKDTMDSEDMDSIYSVNESNLNNPFRCKFANMSLNFSPYDYQNLSTPFLDAGLLQLLPLWSICSGLLAYVDYLHRRGKWKKRRFLHSDEWQSDVWLCLAVVEDLLMWKPPPSTEKRTPRCRYHGDNAFETIHRNMLSNIRYVCWSRSFALYELLYGRSSPVIYHMSQVAKGECGTLDHGFSPAYTHGLFQVLLRYNAATRMGKRKRGEGAATRRLKHRTVRYIRKDSVGDNSDTTPPKRAVNFRSKLRIPSTTVRDFRGHFMGRSGGRLLYRRFTLRSKSYCSPATPPLRDEKGK